MKISKKSFDVVKVIVGVIGLLVLGWFAAVLTKQGFYGMHIAFGIALVWYMFFYRRDLKFSTKKKTKPGPSQYQFDLLDSWMKNEKYVPSKASFSRITDTTRREYLKENELVEAQYLSNVSVVILSLGSDTVSEVIEGNRERPIFGPFTGLYFKVFKYLLVHWKEEGKDKFQLYELSENQK